MAQARQGRNWFAIWISVAVVVVLVGVGVLVVWMNNLANAPAPRPESSGINEETGAVVVGTGAGQVDVFFDFYCPHCQEFEDYYGPTIADLIESDDITLNLHPVALQNLNAASGTDFSERSANAMYCVAEAEPEAAFPFFQSLFALHPSGSGQTDAELASLASEAGAPDISACLEDRTWEKLVAEQTREIPANPETGGAGTPTLLVNGEYVLLTGDPQADIVDRLG